MTWFPTGPAVTLYDRDSYEAFPAAHTHPVTGTTIATWASGGTHYTTAAGRMTRWESGAPTWSAPVVRESGVVQFATFGTRWAMLTMATNPYRGWVQISTDDGVTWGPKLPVGFSVTSGGVFPSGLAWVDDGTADGKMFAVGYWGGVHISTSADAGVTWTVQPKPTHDSKCTEACIVQAADGRLVLMVRRQPVSEAARFEQWHSTDLGGTWTAKGVAVLGGKSTPLMTVTPDGAILLPYRDSLRNDSHSFAVSADNGDSWSTTPLNSGWSMYGQFAVRPSGRAVLVASSQTRGANDDANIWTQMFGVRTDMLISYSTTAYESTDPPRVDLTITQIPAEAARLTVERLLDGQWWTVRTPGTILSGTSAYLEDHEAPVGIPITYRVAAYNPSGTLLAESTRQIDPLPDPPTGHVWLSDPLDALSARLVLCAADSDVDRPLTIPYSDAYPLGSPVVTTSYGTRTWGPIVWIVDAADQDEHRAISSLLTGGVLIRAESARDLPPLIYGPPRDLIQSVDQIANSVRYSRHTFSIVPSVGPGVSTILPRRVWADYMAEAATWADGMAMYPVWRDVIRGGAV